MTTRWLGVVSLMHVLVPVKPSVTPGKFDYEKPIAFETKIIYTSIDYPDEATAIAAAAKLGGDIGHGDIVPPHPRGNYVINAVTKFRATPVGANNFRN